MLEVFFIPNLSFLSIRSAVFNYKYFSAANHKSTQKDRISDFLHCS